MNSHATGGATPPPTQIPCSLDVPGSVPPWAGEDQVVVSCSCVRPRGHDGAHRCSHERPADAVDTAPAVPHSGFDAARDQNRDAITATFGIGREVIEPAQVGIDAQPVTLHLTLGQVKRVARLVAGAVTAEPSDSETMLLLLAVQAEGGREQDRLRAEGHR